MANRIYDSVVAVDSAMGNLTIVGGTSSNHTHFNIIGIQFTYASTLGNCIITAANTLDILAEFRIMAVSTNTGIQSATEFIGFASPLRMEIIKCPTLTAGSARIYLT